MLKLYAIILASLFVPHIQVVTATQAESVLDTSVLIRTKQYVPSQDVLGESELVKTGCSGTYIADNLVLTAAHCFANPVKQIWIRERGLNMSFDAYIKKLDMKRDLALLFIPQMAAHPSVKLAKTVSIGEQVINVGSPYMFEFLVSEGIVATTNFHAKQFKSTYIITTAMINPGSSGGGAFNSKGELIGVNTMTVGGPFGWAGISMAVDLKSIKEFLKER